jgi:hypothetical protein
MSRLTSSSAAIATSPSTTYRRLTPSSEIEPLIVMPAVRRSGVRGSTRDAEARTIRSLRSSRRGASPEVPSVSGTASATLTLPPDVYRYVARFNPSSYFNGLPVMDAFVVFRPTAGTRASGGGWVSDPAAGGNHKAQFAFNVTNGSSGIASGGATFSWLNPTDGYLYAASCSDWSAGGLLVSGNAATLTCRGSLGALNPATGMPVAGLGGSGYSMVLKATDNGGGKSDTLSVTIKTPAGAIAHNLASAGGGQVTIGGGNIMVKQK